jgi:hypothetical protein
MKIHAPIVSFALLVVAVGSFASEPQAPATAAAPAASTAASVAAASAPDAGAIAKAAHSLGYKSRQHDGKTIYCRSETKVGTSFQTTTCLTEDQVTATVKRNEGNKDSVEALQRAFLVGAPSKEPFTGPSSMRGQ